MIGRKIIFTGDFNHNINRNVEWPKCTRDFCSILRDAGFQQHVQEGTHFCSRIGRVNSLLDHLWTNFEREFDVLVHAKVSDHLPVSLCFPTERENETVESVFRDFSVENVQRFGEDKQRIFGDFAVRVDGEIDEEFLRFCAGLSDVLDEYFPVRKKQTSLKGLRMPWIDARLR